MNNSPILVTGGSGTLGRLVVARLRKHEYQVRVLSRQSRPQTPGVEFLAGDLTTGAGIDAAVDRTEIIVHCAGTSKGDDDKTRHLVQAAERVGPRHLVYISVVGADRVPVRSGVDRAMFGYFASKRAAEQVIAESSIPWTTLRATQFHDLMLKTVQAMAAWPVIPVPSGFQFQPVDTDEVAARLVDLALGPPAGLVDDLAGPRAYAMSDLVRGVLSRQGKRGRIVPIWIPGQAAAAIRDGANLSLDHAVGRRTWEDFLAARTLARAA